MVKKSKYCKMGETPIIYECTKCKWQGSMGDKHEKKITFYESVKICPNCKNEEFYGLIN